MHFFYDNTNRDDSKKVHGWFWDLEQNFSKNPWIYSTQQAVVSISNRGKDFDEIFAQGISEADIEVRQMLFNSIGAWKEKEKREKEKRKVFCTIDDLAKHVQHHGFTIAEEDMSARANTAREWRIADSGNLLRIAQAVESIERTSAATLKMMSAVSKLAKRMEKMMDKIDKKNRERETEIDD